MAAAKDDLNVPLIILVGVLFVILTFVSIVLIQVYFYREQAAEHVRKAIEPRREELASLEAASEVFQAQLNAQRVLLEKQQEILSKYK